MIPWAPTFRSVPPIFLIFVGLQGIYLRRKYRVTRARSELKLLNALPQFLAPQPKLAKGWGARDLSWGANCSLLFLTNDDN